MITKTNLGSLKKGEFFTLVDCGPVWVKGEYDRATKKYDVWKFMDVNHCSQMKGTRQVIAGFTF